MGIKYHPGFTIIETMLFLAITGALVAALLGGATSSINTQRYRDSVTNFQSTLQDQYSQVSNVDNSIPLNATSCDTNAVVTTDTGSPAGPRGQDDCVVIGRYLTIVDTTITSTPVIGYNTKDPSSYTTDITELQDYKLSSFSVNATSSQVEWGSRIAWPTVDDAGIKRASATMPRTISLLILRSPKSGTIYSFSADNTSTTLHNMVVAGNSIPGQAQRRICIDSNGLFSGTGGLAILIGAYASGPNAVQLRTNDMGDTSVC